MVTGADATLSGAEQPGAGAKKLLSLQEFLQIGYVQELNRRFLHPLGLALQVTFHGDGAYLLVWDERDDPEGIRFADLSDEDSQAKFERVQSLIDSRIHQRMSRLGYFIQPVLPHVGQAVEMPEVEAEVAKVKAELIRAEEQEVSLALERRVAELEAKLERLAKGDPDAANG